MRKYIAVFSILVFLFDHQLFNENNYKLLRSYFLNQEDLNNFTLFLPIVSRNYPPPFSTDRKFLGIYHNVPWLKESDVNTKLQKADNLTQNGHSVIGWYIALQDVGFTNPSNLEYNNFYGQLEFYWKKGYLSFVNVISMGQSSFTSNSSCPYLADLKSISLGRCDSAIRNMAKLYYQWQSLGEGRKAFIALFPEMNETSGGNPITGDIQGFKSSFERIRRIFAEEGVTDQAWWVFAPNGWSYPEHKFEYYYPGDGLVDIVAFSSYNFGYCKVMGQWGSWPTYKIVYGDYISRMQAMASRKPIIISQTGVVPDYPKTGDKNYEMKNNWIRDSYTRLANEPAVLGVIYFDIDGACNWGITDQPYNFNGYFDASLFFQRLTSTDIESLLGN